MKRTINLKILLFLVLLPIYCQLFSASTVYAQDQIAAIVNNEAITRKDLNDFLNFMTMQLSRQYKGKELENKINSVKSDLLNRLIEDRLMLQEAKKEKIAFDESRIKAKINEIKKNYPTDSAFQADLMKQGITQADLENKIREQFLMYQIIEQKIRVKISVKPDEVTKFYNDNQNEFSSGEEREIEAFALENEDLAESFAYNLKSGKASVDLATRYPFTVNSFSASKGEDLKKEIEEAVFKLGIKEVSDVVKVGDKYYVFRLLNIIPPKKHTLTEAQNKIQAYLFEKKMQEELAKWIDELKGKSYIKIK